MEREAKPNRGKFIVYVDESGDHSLAKVDEGYPVFVLAFCAFYKENYVSNVIAAVENLKFRQFGHDAIILHEREIRKETGPFKFRGKDEKHEFLSDLTTIIRQSNFILISCVIDKRKIELQSESQHNPYHIALGYCLETLAELLEEKNDIDAETHIVFEQRGKKEDRELELEFRRICAGANAHRRKLPFEIVFANKQINSAGLQLADLVARPIGLSHLRPEQENRAFQALKPKFFCKGGRATVGEDFEGYGLKIFPKPKSEKPR